MKVLVTGATGFVGGAVVRRLLADGHAVRAAVRGAKSIDGVEAVVVGDIDGRTHWDAALRDIEVVVHLAARVHVMKDTAAGSALFRATNIEGTLCLARSMREAGARRIVFLSTIKVNGEATRPGQRFSAGDQPAPTDPYSVSKNDAERWLLASTHLEAVVIRPPLVYGPGVKGNLARLCRLAQLGMPVPFGAIHNRRDLLGVDNLADLAVRCVVHPSAAGQVFLAADGNPMSTRQLYSMIADAMTRPARMLSVPPTLLRTLGRVLGQRAELERLTGSLEIDIQKTQRALDWSPPVATAVGIQQMVRAFVEHRLANRAPR